MQKIRPFLWFDNTAEEAANFYASIFPNSRVTSITRNDASSEAGSSASFARFELNGQEFMALNGGPQFKFTEAISLFVECDNQEEVDEFWAKLSEGGEPGQCGWLKDRFGLSWQIIPTALGELMQDEDPEKSQCVTEAMLKMGKIDIAGLRRAYEQA